MARLVRDTLEAEGFTTMHSATSDDAWVAMQSFEPHAAIVDISLERATSGWDLVERIRATEWLQDLPVLVFSGHPRDVVEERAHALGCEYLEKPFTAAGLIDRLHAAIRRAGRSVVTRPVRVVVIAGAYRIEGSVHVEAELRRFSDAWDAAFRDARTHIPVVDARIYSIDAATEVTATSLLSLRKDAVTAAFEAPQ